MYDCNSLFYLELLTVPSKSELSRGGSGKFLSYLGHTLISDVT